jgi:hypothetical protein
MQLHFTPSEFDLLADLLLNHSGHEPLLDQVISRQLHVDLDDLDELQQILIFQKHLIGKEVDGCSDTDRRRILEHRRSLLDSMLEKVSEACAML